MCREKEDLLRRPRLKHQGLECRYLRAAFSDRLDGQHREWAGASRRKVSCYGGHIKRVEGAERGQGSGLRGMREGMWEGREEGEAWVQGRGENGEGGWGLRHPGLSS